MSSISSEFSLSISRPVIRTAELYRIVLRTGDAYYYTSHPQAIDWNGQTYYPLPITRDPIQVNMSGEIDEAKVYMANITGDLVDVLQRNILDDAEVTIVEIVRGSTYGEGQERIVFVGKADVEYNRSFMVLTLRAWLSTLNMVVPRRTVKESCNWIVFDSFCTLIQSSFSYSGVAESGTRTTLVDSVRGILYKVDFDASDDTILKNETIEGQTGGGTALVVNIAYQDDGTGSIWYCELSGTQFVDGEVLDNGGSGQVTLDGTPAEDGVLYQRGELRVRTGDNAGERRMILSDQSYTLTVIPGLPFVIDPSVSYTIYPGCDGTTDTCGSTFANGENFSGYAYGPKQEDVIW